MEISVALWAVWLGKDFTFMLHGLRAAVGPMRGLHASRGVYQAAASLH